MKPKVFWVIFWTISAIVALLFFSDHPLHSDEGAVLNIAWQMWHGKKLYIDFSEYITPGSGYFIFYIWKLLGTPSYLSVKVASALFWLVSAVGLTVIIQQFTKKKIVMVVGVVLWLLLSHFYPLINHNPYSSFVAIWAMAATLLALRQNRPGLYLLSGILSATVFLFLQTKGIAVTVAILLVMIIFCDKRRRAWLKNIFFFGSGWLVTFVLTTLPWSASVLWRHWFILPGQVDYMGYTLYDSTFVISEVTVVFILVGLSCLLRKRIIIVSTIFQIVLYLSSAQLVDMNHFMINSFPAVIVAVFILDRYFFSERRGINLQRSIAAAVLLPLILIGVIIIQKNFKDINILADDLYGKTHAGIFQQVDILQADNVYFGPFLPGWYFEIKKENHFTTAANMTLCPPECQQETLRIFEQVQPEYAMVNYSMVRKFGYSRENLIDQYIEDNYRLCEYRTGPVEIYALYECPVVR